MATKPKSRPADRKSPTADRAGQQNSGSKEPPKLDPEDFQQLVADDLLIINLKASTAQQRQQQFQACHRIGRLLLDRLPDRKSRYGHQAVAELAIKIGRQKSWLYKVRDFSAKFSQQELDQLCGLADRIHWGHVVLLLGIQKKSERARLLRQTHRSDWTSEELRQSLRARPGKPGRGGRPFAQPSGNPAILLRQIILRTDEWLRRYRQVWNHGAESPLRELSSLRGNQGLRVELEAARNSLAEMAAAVRTISRLVSETKRSV